MTLLAVEWCGFIEKCLAINDIFFDESIWSKGGAPDRIVLRPQPRPPRSYSII